MSQASLRQRLAAGEPAFGIKQQIAAQAARGYRVLGYATDVGAMRSAYQQGRAALREA